jgi:hypothetical protein
MLFENVSFPWCPFNTDKLDCILSVASIEQRVAVTGLFF